jgi:hypothetical protein
VFFPCCFLFLTRKFILLLNVSRGFCIVEKTVEAEAGVAIARRVTMGEAALLKRNYTLETLNLQKEFEEGHISFGRYQCRFMKEFYTYKTKGNWRNRSSKRN